MRHLLPLLLVSALSSSSPPPSALLSTSATFFDSSPEVTAGSSPTVATARVTLRTTLRTTLRAIEAEHGLPVGMLRAVWSRECSMQDPCPDGDAGERGPMQVMPRTAGDISCADGWESGAENFRCAAIYLRSRVERCGPRMEALGAYNAGNRCPRSSYAQDVYGRMFSWSPKYSDALLGRVVVTGQPSSFIPAKVPPGPTSRPSDAPLVCETRSSK